MVLSLAESNLADYVTNQVNNYFPDQKPLPQTLIQDNIRKVLERVEYCFSKVNNKYFFNGQHSVFNHLHGDQYAMFLYYLSNTLYKQSVDEDFCSKIFLLNKALHGLDAFYEVALPDIFLVIHPLATVLGRGTYDDYFLVYQRCGIGSNHDIYPTLGKFVTMHPGSAVLGNSLVGNYCSIASESLLIDRSLDDSTIYFGNPKVNSIKSRENNISNFWRII